MASFYQNYCSMGTVATNDWFKDDHISKETTAEEVSAGLNPSPKSPLEVDFEKETGVTLGLGSVPYLARLWQEDPYDRRIVFNINMGADHFSRSLIEQSTANAFGLCPSIVSRPVELIFCSSTPSSPFSSLSQQTLIGSLPDMNLPDNIECLPIDPEYFIFLRDEGLEKDDQSDGSDGLIFSDLETENDLNMNQTLNRQQLAHEEEEDTQVIASGTNPVTTDHIKDNSSSMEQPRSYVGGLSATFGVRANRPAPKLEADQNPNEDIICCFCKKPLDKKQHESISYKFKYSSCPSKQCGKKILVVDTIEEAQEEQAETSKTQS